MPRGRGAVQQGRGRATPNPVPTNVAPSSQRGGIQQRGGLGGHRGGANVAQRGGAAQVAHRGGTAQAGQRAASPLANQGAGGGAQRVMRGRGNGNVRGRGEPQPQACLRGREQNRGRGTNLRTCIVVVYGENNVETDLGIARGVTPRNSNLSPIRGLPTPGRGQDVKLLSRSASHVGVVHGRPLPTSSSVGNMQGRPAAASPSSSWGQGKPAGNAKRQSLLRSAVRATKS